MSFGKQLICTGSLLTLREHAQRKCNLLSGVGNCLMKSFFFLMLLFLETERPLLGTNYEEHKADLIVNIRFRINT